MDTWSSFFLDVRGHLNAHDDELKGKDKFIRGV
jgi:hypothetical protein